MIGRPPIAAEIRFDTKVIKQSDSCWIWIGAKDKNGYGLFSKSTKQRTYKCHRFSYERHNGSIPQGMFICHKCDNPSCVNPEHLFIGTPLDNTRDMIKKGRKKTCPGILNGMYSKPGNNRGIKSPHAILDEQKVLEIRAALPPFKRLSEKYGVKPRTIYAIRSREIWAWL